MAQVSIQYSIDKQLNKLDEAYIIQEMDKVCGVSNVNVNRKTCTVCVDYDDMQVGNEVIEQQFQDDGYVITMLDKITF